MQTKLRMKTEEETDQRWHATLSLDLMFVDRL